MTSALLLAGGQGTRLRALYPDLPKPMAPVAGRPFLEWMLLYLADQGIRDVVLSIGHLAGVIEQHFKSHQAPSVRLGFVRESTPLGTGGAVRFAFEHASLGDPFLVGNADSLVMADLSPAREAMRNEEIDGVILGVEMQDAGRYGTLDVDGNGFLRGFHEKRPGSGIINAGVYVFRHRLMSYFKRFPADTPVSMETGLFPAMVEGGAKILIVPCRADFLDIGTPESFQQAESFIARNFAPHTTT